MENSSPKLPENLRQQIDKNPQAPVDLILRVSEAGDSQQQAIEQAGFRVRHRTMLVPMFAVSGPGQSIFALLDRPWLVAVEPDRPVRTFS